MEKYEVVKRLGRGAQGSVFLVTRKDNGKQYVMKKDTMYQTWSGSTCIRFVECNDEGEANKAFQEAMALQELQHPYICGYREFFVTWDPNEAAMFVCIVMEYYKNGDLERVLQQRRQSKQPIEELIMKKWLGQIIEALVFVHKKQVIHRDLKPSNIFMKEDLSISIGDFGVATIMGDARTRTRTTVGSMNWMAPEVLERPYDERSDVWSTGCIALEMATCGVYDKAKMAGVLFEIKKSPQALEETLEVIRKTYSAELVGVIRTMLRLNFKQRPTAIELLDLPYIKDCLALSGSSLVDSRKKDLTDVKKNPVPKDKGFQPVFDYIKSHIQSENCVKSAFTYLEELSQSKANEPVPDGGKRLIIKAMKDHVMCVDIQILGCRSLSNLILNASDNDLLYTGEVISAIPLAMRAHSTSQDLIKAAVNLLMALSSDEGAAETIGVCGGIQDILAAMRAFPADASLIAACCNALWSLTVNENNAKITAEEKGMADVVKAINTHPTNADLVESAAAAIMSISMEDESLEQIGELDCVGQLISSLETHMKNAKVVKNICMALTNLVEPDEESAYKVLNNPQSDGKSVAGIPLLIEAYNQHKDNADVVESICTLLMELSEYDELCKSMILSYVPNTLQEIQKVYQANEDIMAPCDAALAKFNGGKASNRPVSSRRRK